MAHETELKWGSLRVADETASPLPLTLTTVTGQIVGAVASVTVTQHFNNPLDTPITLEYLFPLPHEAAIVDYQITIGARVIKADIKEAQVARQIFEQALERGQRASLLEQRRPNLFSIEIGSVQPGETIVTQLQYDDRLTYRDGEYEFVFPMGLTPKYHTFDTSPDEMRRVDAPVTLDDAQVAPVEINLSLQPGLNIDPPVSATHPILSTLDSTPSGTPDGTSDQQGYQIKLAERTIPNKDFVLRYQVATDEVRTALWSSQDDKIETILISLLPPQLDLSRTPSPREFIFVIDRSGSMRGGPIEQAKNALRACMRVLSETDTFALQAFNREIEWFKPQCQPVTQANVEAAERWLDRIDGAGGTEILGALEAALTLPVDAERARYVVFLTDGAVSAEEKALRKITKQRGMARIFSFGIGPSVNRYLLVKMAQIGRGTAEFLSLSADIETAITRFQDRVSYPVWQDITLDWQNAENWDTYPEMLPDLYIGDPLDIVTRLKRTGDVVLTCSGTLAGDKIEMRVDVPPAAETNPVLGRVWARARIESLLAQDPWASEKAREQIIALALEHRIVTPYTSLVAVDSEMTSGDETQHVKVAVPLPEGLDIEGFVGGPPFDRVLGAPAGGFAAFSRLASPSHRDTVTSATSSASAERSYERFFRVAERSEAEVARSAPPPERQTIDDRLKWLARTQNIDGSWDNAEMTAVALLAYVRAGHTTRAGNYRRQVDKAARWLLSKLADLQGFDVLVAVRALDELAQAAGDHAVPEEVRATLPDPQSDPARAAHATEHVPVSDQITSLDDLRIAALVQGDVAAAAIDDQTPDALIQAWLAVGQAPAP